MKKKILLFASAALLFTSCAKEIPDGLKDGELTNVSFSAQMDNGTATRAAVDGDAAAASVNRCIMEVYYGDELYTREYAKVNDKVATFNIKAVSNRTYTVAFWADCVVDATSDTGLAADNYYATTSLQNISIKGAYVGNDDKRDAFCHVGQYTVAQAGSSFSDIKLKRPFAQVNVITTDWDKAGKISTLAPNKVNVTLKNALVKFNAVTGEASGSQTLSYTADVYAPLAHGAEKTLSMDYLFASADKSVIDIDWKALHGADASVEHSFASVPYQRNYRTNIKGALLTAQGQWTVTVDPIWANPDYAVDFLAAYTISDAQTYINNTDDNESKTVDLSKATLKLADVDQNDKTIHFKLTVNSPESNVNFNLPAIPQDLVESGCTGWTIDYEAGYPTENVAVNAPSGSSVTINAPDSHVTLNGTEYEQITASTGDNTLVVPAGVTVKNLIVKKGAVEIHGTVNNLTVAPEQGETVVFRACEGLSAAVFAAIKGEGHDYIDLTYVSELNDGKYSIKALNIPEGSVALVGTNAYPTLQAAFDAVPDGVETTVNLLGDATAATIGNKDNIGSKTVVLNLNGHSITGYMRGISTLTGSTSLEGATLVNYANLTINGEGTIGDLEGEYHHNALVNMSDGTNLTINGGTFVAKSCCVYHYSASSQANTASFNVKGGTFKVDLVGPTNKYVFGIGGKSGQTLTFNYGEATAEAVSEGAKGIYCSLAGTTINVHSGSITANINAIYVSMGKNVTINIDGGTLKTLDSENHANNYNSTGSYTGSSLPIYASAFGSENIVCNISGGEFIYPYLSGQLDGTIPATWERVINAGKGITSNVANANITASLTGGTYSTNQMLSDITNPASEASGIVAEGYTCKKNDDGTWTVVAEN